MAKSSFCPAKEDAPVNLAGSKSGREKTTRRQSQEVFVFANLPHLAKILIAIPE
jgi:hypothetical protein